MELNIDRGLKSYDVKDADGTLIGTIRFNPLTSAWPAAWRKPAPRLPKLRPRP